MSNPDATPTGLGQTLTQSLTDVLTEAKDLRTDVRKAEKTRRRETRIALAAIALLAVAVALVATVTWQNNRIAQDTRKTNARIADCTAAGGRCYEQGQARTATAVADLVKASVLVAECSRLHPGESGPGFDAILERCVAAKLAHGAQPSPTASPAPSASASAGR